jgi:outer membrane protein, multidrug efflux system
MFERGFMRPCAAGGVVAALIALAGCAAGPEHRVPALPLAEAFVNAPASTVQSADAATLAGFWHQFDDAALDGLVAAALQNNLDVRIAQARLTEAQATLQGAQAQPWPSLGTDTSVKRSVTPAWQQPAAARSQRTNTVYAPAAVMNWELDLFGRDARATESAAAQVSAQALGVGGAQAVVVAAVASNYLNLRGLQQRLTFAEESLANQSQALRLTEARLAAGRGTPLDVARARNQAAITASGLPALQAQVARTVHRLATLTGLPLAGLSQSLAGRTPLPGLPVTDLAHLPIGTPAALLRRRADIQVAERQLAAATADVGVAMADRFPRISLSGLLGLNSNRAGDLSGGAAGVYALGASLSWTAFDFGRTQARVQASEARATRSVLVYEQTVLTALEETESALSGFTRSAQQAAELTTAANSAQEAATIARKRFAAGSIDQLSVLDAERQLLAARDQLAQAETGTATALVDVYRALGGGWMPVLSAAVATAAKAADSAARR